MKEWKIKILVFAFKTHLINDHFMNFFCLIIDSQLLVRDIFEVKTD